jgi:hypothetical protein
MDKEDSSYEGNDSIQTPAFIRLAEPPSFDIHRHLPTIRNQLPADQLENLEHALKVDPEIFRQASKSDLILDCEAEESFTLESFGNLMKAAKSANKDFIIARVTTLDPSGPKPHIYHSHYSAHQINKILFRTQPEEALLHRMKSRNPLNNMLIVGDVNYYVVRPKDVEAARNRYQELLTRRNEGCNDSDGSKNETTKVEGLENPNPIPSLTAEISTIDNSTSLTDSLLYGLLQRKKLETELAINNGSSPQLNVAPFANAADYTSPNQSAMDLSAPIRASRNTSSTSLYRSDSLNKLPSDGEPAILYEAHPFATDDDFMISPEVREYFKVNSVNPDDYLLFTLYRNNEGGMTEIPVTGFTSVPMPDNSQGGIQRRVRSWKNCWGLFYPPSPSLSTLRTGMISREAYKYILAVYIIGCILALVFFIPLNLSYFVGFGMFSFIVFVTVFLVECNPSPDSTRWNIFTHRQRMQRQREMANADSNITSSQPVFEMNNSAATNSSTALNQV